MVMKKYPNIIKGVEQKYPNVPAGSGIYSRCVQVDNLLFLSGMTAQSPDTGVCLANTPQEQTRICYEKLRKALEDAGSSLDNLVRTLILFKDMSDYPVVRAAELAYWQEFAPGLVDEPPASTVVEGRLARREFLVEIEAIAVLKK